MLSGIHHIAISSLLATSSQIKPTTAKKVPPMSPFSKATGPVLPDQSTSIKKRYPQSTNACMKTSLQIELEKDRGEGFQKLETNEEKLKWAIQYTDVTLLRLLLKEGTSVKNDEIQKGLATPNKEIAAILSDKKNADQKVEGQPPIMTAVLIGNIHSVQSLINKHCDVNAKDDPTGNTALMAAAQLGYIEILKLLLKEKVNSNLQSDQGFTALMLAAQYGHIQATNLLLQNGADPNSKTNEGGTALMLAAQYGHIQTTNLVLQNGADPNLKSNKGGTALMAAAQYGHTPIINLLLQKEADPNLKRNEGGTALMLAAQYGHIQATNLLLQNGADTNLQSNEGHSALMFALKSGHIEIFDLLLQKGADPNLQSNEGLTALMFAVKLGHIDVFDLLLQKGADPNLQNHLGQTALQYALFKKNEQIVRLLLKYGATLNSISEEDLSNSSEKIQGIIKNKRLADQKINGTPLIVQASTNQNIVAVRKLVEDYCNINAKDPTGRTALIGAAYQGHTEVVEYLLQQGANPNLQDNKGQTALMAAMAAAHQGHIKIVDSLLQKGADPNLISANGITTLMLAAQEGHTKVVESLLQRGADSNLKTDKGLTALMLAAQEGHTDVVEYLLQQGANPNLQDNKGATALMIAAEKGHTEAVEALLQKGADPNLIRPNGITALMIASEKGHTKVVYSLLQRGADSNLKTDIGLTALMIAAQEGHTKVVDSLLQRGADPNLKTDIGLTALMLAAQEGHTDVVESLLQNGASSNLKSYKGHTALGYAFFRKNEHIVKLLLKYGATLDSISEEDLSNSSEKIQGIIKNKKLADQVNGTPLIVEAATNQNIVAVRKLVEDYCDINAKDPTGRTALMGAAQEGHTDVVEYLLQQGAKPDLQDNFGSTALMAAMPTAHQAHIKIVDSLLQKGADPNLIRPNGITALMIAAEKGHTEVVKSLLEVKAKPDLISTNGFTALMFAAQNGCYETVALLLKENADINLGEKQGITPLMIAAQEGHAKVVKALLEGKAKPDLIRPNGFTALMIASEKGHTEVVKALLEGKAKPDLIRPNGISALMIAAYQGHTKVVKALLKGKAKPDLISINGITALMLAAQEGHTEVVKALLKKQNNKLDLKKALDIAKQNAREPVATLIENSLTTQQLQSTGHTAVITLLEDLVSKKTSTPQQGASTSFCEVESFEEYLTRTQYLSKDCPLGLNIEKVPTAELQSVLEKPEPKKTASQATSDRSSMLASGSAFVATSIAAAGSAIAYYLHQENALLNAVLTHQDENAFKILWVRTVRSQTRHDLTSFLLANPLFALRFFSQNIDLLKQHPWNTFLNVFWDQDNGLNTVFSTHLDTAISNLTVQEVSTLYLKIAQPSPETSSLQTFARIILEKLSRDERYTSHTKLQNVLRELSNSLTRFDRKKIEDLFGLLSIQPSANYDPSEIQEEILKQLCNFYSNQHPLTIQRVFFETLFSKNVPKMNKKLFGNNIEDGQLEEPLALEPIEFNQMDEVNVLTVPNKMVYSSQAFSLTAVSIFPPQYPTNADLVAAIRVHHANPTPIPQNSVQDSYGISLSQKDLMMINRPHDENFLHELQLLLHQLGDQV